MLHDLVSADFISIIFNIVQEVKQNHIKLIRKDIAIVISKTLFLFSA